MIKRIMIFGCCGCGKTTLSKKIHKITNLPLIHLDSINWQDNWHALPFSEFNSIVKEEVKKKEWIIEGLYIRTLETRMRYADTIIYLDTPRRLCIFNIIKRVILNHGKSRDGMPQNCKEKFDYQFMKCVWNYNKKYRSKFLKKLEDIHNKNVYIIKNKRNYKDLIQELNCNFSQNSSSYTN